ncbi:MAG: glycosyltransferase family 2 protein [Candidatus Ancillula trichonymphae]|nr:glycosyltransferase family 2 protein [Candidatus Ancillula trichonymphae]
MSRLTVSIVIPVYNESAIIRQCLAAALNQRLKPLEIVVVNNMSTDDTEQLVQDFAREYKSAGGTVDIWLVQENARQGMIPARNTGFEAAVGDILGRIDADTLICPGWTQAVVNAYTSDSKVMGVTGPVTYYDMPMRRFALRRDNEIRKAIQLFSQRKDVILFGSNMSIRARAWKALGREFCLDLEDKLHEDVDITVHFKKHGYKIVYVEKMVAGVSARRIENRRKDFIKYQNKLTNTYTHHNEKSRSARIAKAVFLSIYFPLHALRYIYSGYYKKIQAECEVNLWSPDGKMSPLSHRAHAKLNMKSKTRRST